MLKFLGWREKAYLRQNKILKENLDLVKNIYEILQRFFVRPEIRKCEGHQGDLGNELADALATENYRRFIGMCDSAGLELSNNDIEWLEREMDENK